MYTDKYHELKERFLENVIMNWDDIECFNKVWHEIHVEMKMKLSISESRELYEYCMNMTAIREGQF